MCILWFGCNKNISKFDGLYSKCEIHQQTQTVVYLLPSLLYHVICNGRVSQSLNLCVCVFFIFLLCYAICLHAVREPREQIADAEAVLEIANSFFQCLRETKRKSSLSPTTFVSYLINKFRVQTASVHDNGDDESSTVVDWGKLGLRGCGLFRQCPGLSTM